MSERLRDRALAIALTQEGVRETAPNSGPQVDRYLHAVGLPPGHPWCAAFVVWCYSEAARSLDIRELPIKRTGKVVRLWSTASARFAGSRPVVGAIYCHATTPGDPDSPGHCGIVTEVLPDGWILGIEGNTNRKGSRAGDCVWLNRRAPSYVNLGYLDLGNEVTAKIKQPQS